MTSWGRKTPWCEQRTHEGILGQIARCGKDRQPILISLFALSTAGSLIVQAVCHFMEQQTHNLLWCGCRREDAQEVHGAVHWLRLMFARVAQQCERTRQSRLNWTGAIKQLSDVKSAKLKWTTFTVVMSVWLSFCDRISKTKPFFKFILWDLVQQFCTKFGIGVLYKISLSKHEFREIV